MTDNFHFAREPSGIVRLEAARSFLIGRAEAQGAGWSGICGRISQIEVKVIFGV